MPGGGDVATGSRRKKLFCIYWRGDICYYYYCWMDGWVVVDGWMIDGWMDGWMGWMGDVRLLQGTTASCGFGVWCGGVVGVV